MKKTFLFMFLLSIFLTGCNNQATPETNSGSSNKNEKIVTESPPKKTELEDEDNIIKVTGGYNYYLETDNSVAPYKKTALNRVCFEPAQMETVNNGQLFCFSNTQEVLEILKIEKINNKCKKYWGTAEIKIKNLSEKNMSNSKANPCMQDGSCEFNEAELIEVSKFYEDEPQCKK